VKRITIQNDRTHKVYRRIVEVVGHILEQSNFVALVDVFVRMDLLSEEALDDWRAGRVPYLEKVVKCNLAKVSRILRILRIHAHDLNLAPSPTGYRRRARVSLRHCGLPRPVTPSSKKRTQGISLLSTRSQPGVGDRRTLPANFGSTPKSTL